MKEMTTTPDPELQTRVCMCIGVPTQFLCTTITNIVRPKDNRTYSFQSQVALRNLESYRQQFSAYLQEHKIVQPDGVEVICEQYERLNARLPWSNTVHRT